MSYTPNNVEQAIWDAVKLCKDAGGASATTLIYDYPDAPRPGAGATFLTVGLLADLRLGTSETHVTDTVSGADFVRETRLQHRLDVAITAYGPTAYEALSAIVMGAEIPEVVEQIAALNVALPRMGVARRIPAEVGVEFEDRWTLTAQGAYEEILESVAPVVARIEATPIIDGVEQADIIITSP
jgi:hypothetical protein